MNKYGISYRDLEEMMTERGLTINHTTVYRWVQYYAPELKKRLEWHKKRYASRWHLDETYMRMFKKGQFNCWMYGNRNEVSFINEQFGLYS